MTSNPRTIKCSRVETAAHLRRLAHLSCSRLYGPITTSLWSSELISMVCAPSDENNDHERRSRSSEMGGPKVVMRGHFLA